MARPRKSSTVEEQAKLADELIQAQAKLRGGDNEPAPDDEDNELPPVDDSDDPPEDNEGLEGYDLSSLDEDEPPPQANKDLEHKLSVLQGKYNAETERLSTLLSQTMTELQTLKAQVNTRPHKQDEHEDLPDEDTSVDALRATYPSLYKSFLKLAKDEVMKATKGTQDKVEEITKQADEKRKEVYYSRLSEAVSSWEQINNHPSFLKWLNEPDEFSGTTRRNLLAAAHYRLDYKTTAKFFNTFIKEKGIRVKGKSNDSDELAPDTSGASVNRSNRSTGGEVTRAQMQKFYQDKANGKITGTQAEIDKMEAKFFQAVREGKVRN